MAVSLGAVWFIAGVVLLGFGVWSPGIAIPALFWIISAVCFVMAAGLWLARREIG